MGVNGSFNVLRPIFPRKSSRRYLACRSKRSINCLNGSKTLRRRRLICFRKLIYWASNVCCLWCLPVARLGFMAGLHFWYWLWCSLMMSVFLFSFLFLFVEELLHCYSFPPCKCVVSCLWDKPGSSILLLLVRINYVLFLSLFGLSDLLFGRRNEMVYMQMYMDLLKIFGRKVTCLLILCVY